MKKLIVAVMVVLGLLWMVAYARGHGQAAWIMSNPDMAWCCTPTDCLPAYAGEIERTDNGWHHIPTDTVIPYGSDRIYISDDSEVWRCIYAGVMRCIFLPVGV